MGDLPKGAARLAYDGRELHAATGPGRGFMVDARCLRGTPVLGAYAHVCALPDAAAALEFARDGINVNSLAPGMVLTPFNQQAIDDPKFRDEQVQSIPLKRAAQPEEIARLALFLASSDADYVTGSEYVMDGGLMRSAGQDARAHV
jgi:hypothetical protein